MRRLLPLLLLITIPAQAGPIAWAKRHPLASKLIAATGSATVHAIGLAHCRRGDFERCDERYGSAWAGYGVATAGNFALVAISEKIGGKTGWAIAAAADAVQTGWGVHEYLNYHPKERKDDPKPDLSGLVPLRH